MLNQSKKIALLMGFMFLVGVSYVVSAGSTGNTAAVDGKSIFVTSKCNTCHSVTAQSITVVSSNEAKPAKAPPDLSGIGLQKNADWMAKYLLKKEDLNGVKHLKKFRGSDEDLQTLVTWLAAQKHKK